MRWGAELAEAKGGLRGQSPLQRPPQVQPDRFAGVPGGLPPAPLQPQPLPGLSASRPRRICKALSSPLVGRSGSSGHASPGSGMPLWPVQTATAQAGPASPASLDARGARPGPARLRSHSPGHRAGPARPPHARASDPRPLASLSGAVSAGSRGGGCAGPGPARPGTASQLAVTQPGRRGQEPVLAPSVNGPLAKTSARGHTLLQGCPVPHSLPKAPAPRLPLWSVPVPGPVSLRICSRGGPQIRAVLAKQSAGHRVPRPGKGLFPRRPWSHGLREPSPPMAVDASRRPVPLQRSGRQASPLGARATSVGVTGESPRARSSPLPGPGDQAHVG